MKPILFQQDITSFNTNYGLGVLSDAISCIVTEERNGIYELEMTYPIDGIHCELLIHSKIIYAKPFDGGSNQPFRIYHVSKPMNGIITINAEHISYQLSHIPCGPFTASNVAQALQRMKDNAWETCPFNFWTDLSTVANYEQTEPASMRSRLGGVEGSILDVYGGEFEWDKYDVKLHWHRGSNNGVVLNYGKNITDIQQEENIANTKTGIVPYYKGSDGTILTLPEHAVHTTGGNFPYYRTEVVDFSSEFDMDTPPTVAQLRRKAYSYMSSYDFGKPKVNLTISFVALWQTDEYKDIAVLERVKLCDTVTVHFEKLGIDVESKVVKTVYDVLLERYNEIELGDSTSNLSKDLTNMNNSINGKVTNIDLDRGLTNVTDEYQQAIATQTANITAAYEQAIQDATDLIKGGLGGYVVMNTNADGEPEEILIMDTPSTQTAVNVIRMNKNGIGFSNTGYSGTYSNAWTIDGKLNADFITTGKLTTIAIESVDIKSATIDGTAITGGTIDGAVITGSTFKTPDNQGYQLWLQNSSIQLWRYPEEQSQWLSLQISGAADVGGNKGAQFHSGMIWLDVDHLYIKGDLGVPREGTSWATSYCSATNNYSFQCVQSIQDNGDGTISWTTVTNSIPYPSTMRTMTFTHGLVTGI